MNRGEAYEKVVQILSPFAKNKKGLETISDKSRLTQDLGINSARMLDIVSGLEETFGVEIEDEVADQMDTVGKMVELLLPKIPA